MKRIPLFAMLIAPMLLAGVVFSQEPTDPVEVILLLNDEGLVDSETPSSEENTLATLLGIDQAEADPVAAAQVSEAKGPPPGVPKGPPGDVPPGPPASPFFP